MNKLYVFYDRDCELCRRCREWLIRQPAFVALEFIPFQAPICRERFPELAAYQPEREIIVVSESGDIYRGASAWIMCLWATQTYREWSERLSHPALYGLVRRFCALVSANRLRLSSLLKVRAADDLAAQLEAHAEVFCADDTCAP